MKRIFWGDIHFVHATVLRDGRALVVAGPNAALFETLEPLEIAAPPRRRGWRVLVATSDGNALVIDGGKKADKLRKCERFDALTATWSPGPDMHIERSYFGAVALDDRVLVIGRGPTESLRTGARSWELEPLPELEGDWFAATAVSKRSVLVGSTLGTWLWTLESNGTWRVDAGPERSRATLVALRDGGALVCGGLDEVRVDRLGADGTWTRLPDLPESRANAVGLELEDGRVLLAGGSGTREVSEDDSDGGQLDLEYRTVGEVRWVPKLIELQDAAVAASAGAEWKTKYLAEKVEKGFRFGSGVLFVHNWSALWWDGS
ncbi:MAG: kelch repeat-containing protein [Archangium sp.]